MVIFFFIAYPCPQKDFEFSKSFYVIPDREGISFLIDPGTYNTRDDLRYFLPIHGILRFRWIIKNLLPYTKMVHFVGMINNKTMFSIITFFFEKLLTAFVIQKRDLKNQGLFFVLYSVVGGGGV